MHIVCATDDNYAMHLGVMLTSLLENTDAIGINFYIIDGGLSEENKKKLKQTVINNNSNVQFLSINKEIYQKFKVKNIGHATYYRLSIPELIPNNIDKILYLDCDLIVRRNIRRLWELDISGYVLAAMVEAEVNSSKKLQMGSNEKYFNAGVMLINLDLWREYNISEKSVDFLKEYSYIIDQHDQDALNATIGNELLKSLHPCWNQSSGIYNHKTQYQHYYGNKIVNEAMESPAVIHFTTSLKPWKFLCSRPYSDEYFYYLYKSLWSNYKYEGYEIVKEKIENSLVLVIFGTGSASNRIYNKLESHVISYYVDNNSEKWNQSLNGKTIFSPSKLLDERRQELLIVVGSSYYDEIKEQLEDYGFVEHEDFISGLGYSEIYSWHLVE